MGTMPWHGAHTNWGYTNRDLKVAVPFPNDNLEQSTMLLVQAYTWADLASAVEAGISMKVMQA
jgi:hypothetical protein